LHITGIILAYYWHHSCILEDVFVEDVLPERRNAPLKVSGAAGVLRRPPQR
jgi:hypothetical protein